MDNEIVKRLVWSGMLAASGALASVARRERSRRSSGAASSTKTHRTRGADARAEPDATAPVPPPVPPPVPRPDKRSVAELVFDVSEGTSSLIREEIELAKAEVSEKVTSLLRGSAVGVAAGTFAFLALILIMEGIAWLLNEEVFDGKVWPGFFVEAAVFLLIAALAGFIAYRAVKKGAPPVPEQAIEEAKLTKEMFVEGRQMSTDPKPVRPSTVRPAGPHRGADPPRHRPQRQQLGTSVEALRGRVTELTDWRRQVDEHKRELIIGAAVVGLR